MCFSTTCLSALGSENDPRSSPGMMSSLLLQSPFPSSLLFKPFRLGQITLQLVYAASSRADVINNSPYTLDPPSSVFGHVTDPNSTGGKIYSPVIGLFFNSFVQCPYRGAWGGAGAVASWWSGHLLAVPEYYQGHSRDMPGSWVQVSSAAPGAQGSPEMLHSTMCNRVESS